MEIWIHGGFVVIYDGQFYPHNGTLPEKATRL
jgi:hypothetical protein